MARGRLYTSPRALAEIIERVLCGHSPERLPHQSENYPSCDPSQNDRKAVGHAPFSSLTLTLTALDVSKSLTAVMSEA